MKIRPFLLMLASTSVFTGCSSSPTEPHLVTALEAYGGPIGNTFALAAKNRQSNNSMSQGIGQCLYNTQLCNAGIESKGLRITAKGDALTSGKITNLVAVVEAQGSPENTMERTIYLHKAEQDIWTGFTLMPLKSQHPSSGATKCDQMLNFTLYGDLIGAGSGKLDIEISPYEATQQAPLKNSQTLQILAEHSFQDNLFSVPSDFPLTSYTGATYVSGHRSKIGASVLTINLKTKDSPEQVLQYYKTECAGRGFSIIREPAGTTEGRALDLSNGIYEVSLEANKDKDDKFTSIVVKVNAASNGLAAGNQAVAPASGRPGNTVNTGNTTNTPFTPPATDFDTKP